MKPQIIALAFVITALSGCYTHLSITDGDRLQIAYRDISTISMAVHSFNMMEGSYPSNLNQLVEESYLTNGIPNDPWKRPYHYNYPGLNQFYKFDLVSYGKDGVESDDDIRNWESVK